MGINYQEFNLERLESIEDLLVYCGRLEHNNIPGNFKEWFEFCMPGKSNWRGHGGEFIEIDRKDYEFIESIGDVNFKVL